MKRLLGCAALAAAIVAGGAGEASAFCGFYVNGAGGEMYADATQVVLMRMGTRTVMSMQNAYQGPLEDFALVIPVPVVLQEEDVKTLSKESLAKVDAMGAPRLVEYWEQDPCGARYPREEGAMRKKDAAKPSASGGGRTTGNYGVTIEAQFVVGEYQIVILSAKDSAGLDGYLRSENYKIPEGAEPLLRPYVEAGSKFFVAKVDPEKVKFDAEGRAQLSPLRFHYDHDELVLPIRLGLANSSGKQDLIVNVLSPEGRYTVSNYQNVTIPTNLDVRDEVRDKFGEFYAALFDRTVEKNPGAIITEYAWDASTCDPCPGPQLTYRDFDVLGADVLAGAPGKAEAFRGRGFVLTRLHARYGKGDVPDDLVFGKATPIVGGREHVVDETGKLEEGSREDRLNNFQGRYAIRHEWTGPIECENPVRGRWGGPPRGEPQRPPIAARDLAFAPRGQVRLPDLVAQDIPEIGVKAAGAAGSGGGDPRGGSRGRTKTGDPDGKGRTGCGCQSGGGSPGSAVVLLAALGLLGRRRGSRLRLGHLGLAAVALAGLSCSSPASRPVGEDPAPRPPAPEALLPRPPGSFAPSFMALAGDPDADGAVVDGAMLSDVDTCSTCHADIANQWGSSAHSFASFNNPIYRVNVELARDLLGKEQSQHCGGCHDVALQVDGLMTAEIPTDDLRSHSGVTCRLCHGIDQVSSDGNGSWVLARAPIGTPNVDDPASVEAHRKDATLAPLGSEVCVACHRGFLSPDVDVPVHMSGIDEPTFWRSSAYTGSGAGRVDKVEKKSCIDCHMAPEEAGADEVAAHDGVVASHRFLGGHSWMAGMRGDAEQLRRTQAMLEGVASIDVMPAPAAPEGQTAVDVVVRNLLVGHRFPGGVNDVQDTWIEVEVHDARGKRLASSGLSHRDDADDDEAHVLRSYPVGEDGQVLEEHQLPRFRGLIANHTIAARDAVAVRYPFTVPARAAQPLRVTARLRHRSRTLRFQREVCRAARTAEGQAFIDGTRAARDADLDPCKPQPVTEIASTTVTLGEPAGWERRYEHGMALTAVVGERLDEARRVLEDALAAAPEGEAGHWARAAIQTQLAIVAGRQGRTDDALGLLDAARVLLPADKQPPVLDYAAADALARVWRWEEAEAFAERAAEKAPLSTPVWVMLARARGSLHDDRGALEAARRGLAISPRDPDLLRSQAAALRGLDPTLAELALAAYDRFRAPDGTSALRMTCAAGSARCAREREAGHSHEMVQTAR